MSEHIEIALTSDASGATWTCCAWDPRAGTVLQPYRAGGSTPAAPRAIAYIAGRHVVAANASKPLLHIWPVNSQDQVPGVRFVTPGRCTALDVTADGNYLIAGIAESVYVWQLCSGHLLAVLARHFQTVTRVRCTADGGHFVTAGQDGMVFVWNLFDVINGSSGGGGSSASANQQTAAPLYAFADHALPVTDVHVGPDGMRAHLATVSLDRSVKLYDLASGQQLLSVVFEDALTAVAVDHTDSTVYVGCATGAIHSFNLAAPPRQREHHVNTTTTAQTSGDDAKQQRHHFAGHTAGTRVLALSVSVDGVSLLSGGEDGNALLWDIGSGQQVRQLAHKGAVTTAFFALAPAAMFDAEARLPLISGNLQRMLHGAAKGEDVDQQVVEVMVQQAAEDADGVESEERVWREILADAVRGEEATTEATTGDGAIGVRAPKAAVNGTNGADRQQSKQKQATAKNGDGGGGGKSDASEVERLRVELQTLKQKYNRLYQTKVATLLKK